MKTVLFIPGFKEDITSRDYKSTVNAIESKGYKVKFIPIAWKRTVITDWLDDFNKEYAKHNPQDTILAGFSYGSMVAFLAACKVNPYELWLFSFSPYFAEDIPKLKKAWLNQIGHRRVTAFKTVNFNDKAKCIKCKTLIFYGDLEVKKYPIIGERARLAHKLIKNSSLIAVPNSGHDVANKAYIQAITERI